VEGAANQELLRFLADLFERPRASIELIRGQGSRHKVARLSGLKAVTVLAVLAKREIS
jgi:uncharacterized protein YggU (UPF0235/DUF167 family)